MNGQRHVSLPCSLQAPSAGSPRAACFVEVFCRVHTFGKALGVHGAVVVGPRVLRHWAS